jgi:hypothetical protein
MDSFAQTMELGSPHSKSSPNKKSSYDDDEYCFNYAGVNIKNDQNRFYDIFIKVSKKLTEVSRVELIRLARLLPIVYGNQIFII